MMNNMDVISFICGTLILISLFLLVSYNYHLYKENEESKKWLEEWKKRQEEWKKEL